MFETQIKEVEKGCGKKINCGNFHLYCGDSGMYKLRLCPTCQAKLSILESCQAKAKEQEELNNDLIDSANLELTRFKAEFKNIDDKRLYWKKKSVSLIKELEQAKADHLKFVRLMYDFAEHNSDFELKSVLDKELSQQKAVGE